MIFLNFIINHIKRYIYWLIPPSLHRECLGLHFGSIIGIPLWIWKQNTLLYGSKLRLHSARWTKNCSTINFVKFESQGKFSLKERTQVLDIERWEYCSNSCCCSVRIYVGQKTFHKRFFLPEISSVLFCQSFLPWFSFTWKKFIWKICCAKKNL